jgi:hypothetical protein
LAVLNLAEAIGGGFGFELQNGGLSGWCFPHSPPEFWGEFCLTRETYLSMSK